MTAVSRRWLEAQKLGGDRRRVKSLANYLEARRGANMLRGKAIQCLKPKEEKQLLAVLQLQTGNRAHSVANKKTS